nr:hypothetical protein [Tanacetum cinerariifolium]
MELYMENRENGRMILESVKHGPLIWPTIEENEVTRTKKYAELSATEKIQADCDMKAINIIFKLHAYLEQHELHANEVSLMRERSQDPLALVANHQMTPSHFNTYQSSYNNPQFQQQQKQFSQSESLQYGLTHPIQHYSTTYPSTPLAITYPLATNYSSQQRVMKCFNYQWEGHKASQCPKPKRKRDATWFKEKFLLVEAQGNGKVLNEEELEFLADLESKIHSDSNVISYSRYLIESQNAAV